MSIGKNSKGIGKQNAYLIMKLLMINKSLSRREIAEELGLTKMTVGNIVNQLKEKGYVKEEKLENDYNAIGPKPTAVTIMPRGILAVGVHITSTKITVMLVDIVDGVLYEQTASVDKMESNQQFMNYLKEMIASLLNRNEEYSDRIVGIGVTYSGIVDCLNGKISFCINEIEKEDINIRSTLAKRFDLPVVVSTEAEGATIAEIVFGARITARKIYYLNISDSIRGDCIDSGMISHGVFGMSGEVGHMSIKYDGPLCDCGSRGCYHLFAGINVLLKTSECHSLEELELKIQDRDPLAVRTIEEFIQITTSVLVNIVHLYDPHYILIGGDITKLNSSIFKKIERILNERILYRKERHIRVVCSKVKKDANVIGAAMVVINGLFE